jgi:hypothetical protein
MVRLTFVLASVLAVLSLLPVSEAADQPTISVVSSGAFTAACLKLSSQ